jgi:exodeoxyribonuclease VII large subunit
MPRAVSRRMRQPCTTGSLLPCPGATLPTADRMNTPVPRTVHSVSELADVLRALVEDSMPRVWVEGEISNLSRPASGHWYFTLKDAQAQIRCAMFRNANYLVRPLPQNGDRVLVRAQVSYYTARGELQLVCEHLEPAGVGALLRAFEALKQRLLAEGLFDAAHKRPLPALPRRIGLITSATGAAVQDVRAALARRFPLLRVMLWPVPVQGATAAPAIVEALRELPRRTAVDAILLVRGGGSLEDLWAFNEESVARAIRACLVPVVTGVGHETDTTIADFAADLRAPTPTAAAELLSPDRQALLRRIEQAQLAVHRTLGQALRAHAGTLQWALQSLQRMHPRRLLQTRAQDLDESNERLVEAMQRAVRAQRLRHDALVARLLALMPARRLAAERTRLGELLARQRHAGLAQLRLRRAGFERREAMLASLSPQAVLDRGYAIARDAQGRVLRDPASLEADAEFSLLLARGSLRARRQD